MNENELVKKLLKGDESALIYYYRHYSSGIRSFLKGKIEDHKDREEIIQDIFMASLESLRDFNSRSSLSTFIFAITRYKLCDYYRRRKLKQTVFSKIPSFESLLSPIMTPEEKMDRKEIASKVKKVLNSLLPKYRTLLEDKYMDGKSLKDIAGSMAVTVKSVESMITRARKAFVVEFEKVS